MHVFAAMISMLFLAACGTGAQIAPVAYHGQEDRAHGPAALEGAVLSFMGDSYSRADIRRMLARGGGGGGGVASSGGGGSSIPYRERHSRETALGLAARWPAGERAVAVRALAGGGGGRYHLPEGAGILTDPITIRARTRFIEATAMVAQRFALPLPLPGAATLAGGVGVRHLRSRLEIRSALLDVRDTTVQSRGFVQLEARYDLVGPPGPGGGIGLVAQGRLYGRRTGLLRTGFVAGF